MRLVAAGEREAARESAAAFVSTFHGFCARLLRAHAVLAGRSPDFAAARRRPGRDAARARLRRARSRAGSTAGGALELAAAFGVDGLRERDRAPSTTSCAAAASAEPTLPARVRATTRRARATRWRARRPRSPPSSRRARSAGIERALDRLEGCAELLAGGEAAHSPLRAASSRSGTGEAGARRRRRRLRGARGSPTRGLRGPPRRAGGGAARRLLGASRERYAASSAAARLLDFDDLELEAGALLRDHEEVRDAVVASASSC